ncbi:SEC-C metal-binding domain-containing protein [Streptomyces sp. BR123]|uniref:SEC-C metal-binding domain-containing protein n=1 Tax=Streptomyces sp. BR123 TaxID=2749828 RepID=UPI0034D98037
MRRQTQSEFRTGQNPGNLDREAGESLPNHIGRIDSGGNAIPPRGLDHIAESAPNAPCWCTSTKPYADCHGRPPTA